MCSGRSWARRMMKECTGLSIRWSNCMKRTGLQYGLDRWPACGNSSAQTPPLGFTTPDGHSSMGITPWVSGGLAYILERAEHQERDVLRTWAPRMRHFTRLPGLCCLRVSLAFDRDMPSQALGARAVVDTIRPCMPHIARRPGKQQARIKLSTHQLCQQ